MSPTAEHSEPRRPAWIRDQILANGKFLYPSNEVSIITGREAMAVVRFDSTVETRYLHYAHLFEQLAATVVVEDEEDRDAQRNGSVSVSGFVVLLYGTTVVGTTEDAIENLLWKTEEEVHKVLGRMHSKMLGEA